LLLIFLLTGCARTEGSVPSTVDVLAMDTVMTLTVYSPTAARGGAILERATALIKEMEAAISVTGEGSEVYRINHSGGGSVALTGETRQLISEALALCASTDGALDVTVYPIVRAWGFTTQGYRVPDTEELSELLPRVDYRQVILEGDTLTIPEGVEIDLGAVAKGYAGDRLMELFASEGVTSAIVSLGGNVQTLGAKPDGSSWRVAIQAPEGGYAAVVEAADKAVVTSGGYQRYFVEDGEAYHHIMDPSTGRPAEGGLASVTIVADSGTQADGLSTALFVMGREGAEKYWRSHRDFDFILLTEDGSVVITEGLEGYFSLYGAWTGRAVETIR